MQSFNPRARVGRDSRLVADIGEERVFQSTRPRGARPAYPISTPKTGCFNPRARVGRDYMRFNYMQ